MSNPTTRKDGWHHLVRQWRLYWASRHLAKANEILLKEGEVSLALDVVSIMQAMGD